MIEFVDYFESKAFPESGVEWNTFRKPLLRFYKQL